MSADALSVSSRIALQRQAASGRSRGAGLPMTAVDDSTLVRQCLAGDTPVFDELVERHRRQVYQVCYRFVNNHEDASDLTQDAFLRAYRALHTFKGNSAFSPWLYRVAVNIGLNRVSEKRAATEPIEQLDDAAIREKINALRDHDEQTAIALRPESEAVDEVPDARQQGCSGCSKNGSSDGNAICS